MSTKRKLKIYWICEETSKTHRQRGLAMADRGFDLHFFSSHQDLISQVKANRVSIILIDDSLPTEKAIALINLMLMTPELQGVRFLLSVITGNQEIADHAAASAFRDLIPLALSEKAWINRVIYSSARQAITWPQDNPRISMPSIAKISVPGRIVWISPQRILIEARLRPLPQTSLSFSGAFADAIGAKSISLSVAEHRHTGLVYRFSDAILCSWGVGEDVFEKAQKILSDMQARCLGPRCRIFLASSSANVRQIFAKALDSKRFDLNFALQKQSLVDEPKYFSPDAVFIDSSFFLPDDADLMKQAMANLENVVPIYVLGRAVDRAELQERFPDKNFTFLTNMPSRLADSVYQKYLDSVTRGRYQADVDATHLSPNHPFSTLKIHMSARLQMISRSAISFGVNSPLGNHGIYQFESPLLTKVLGRAPYLKIHSVPSESEDSKSHTRIYESFLTNIGARERYKIGVGLAEYITQKFVENTDAVPIQLPQAVGDTMVHPEPSNLRSLPQDQAPPKSLPPLKQIRSQEPESYDDERPIIGQAISQSVKTILSETQEVLYSQSFKKFLIILSAIIFTVTVVWASNKFIAPQWHKSGDRYLDPLLKIQKKNHPYSFDKDQEGEEP